MGAYISFCEDCMKEKPYRIVTTECDLQPHDDEDEDGYDQDGRDDKTRRQCARALQFYDLGKRVGLGATSVVYEVVRKYRSGSGKETKLLPLACKVINKRRLMGLARDIDPEAILAQLRKEIAILKSIDHPHVVGFHDYVETNDALYLITEYAEGAELFQHLAKYGPLSEDLARDVLRGVFSAVSYLHDKGVLHRDIKAENVIMQLKEDAFGRDLVVSSVKLIDFGFSTFVRRTDVTGSFLGTGGYLAPEIRQQRLYGASIDNWALGVLLYCTIAGQLPFGASFETMPCLSRQSCKQLFPISMEGKKWAKVSTQCKDLISKLLEVDPLRRMTSKQALWHPWFKKQRAVPTMRSASNLSSAGEELPNRPQQTHERRIRHMTMPYEVVQTLDERRSATPLRSSRETSEESLSARLVKKTGTGDWAGVSGRSNETGSRGSVATQHQQPPQQKHPHEQNRLDVHIIDRGRKAEERGKSFALRSLDGLVATTESIPSPREIATDHSGGKFQSGSGSSGSSSSCSSGSSGGGGGGGDTEIRPRVMSNYTSPSTSSSSSSSGSPSSSSSSSSSKVPVAVSPLRPVQSAMELEQMSDCAFYSPRAPDPILSAPDTFPSTTQSSSSSSNASVLVGLLRVHSAADSLMGSGALVGMHADQRKYVRMLSIARDGEVGHRPGHGRGEDAGNWNEEGERDREGGWQMEEQLDLDPFEREG